MTTFIGKIVLVSCVVVMSAAGFSMPAIVHAADLTTHNSASTGSWGSNSSTGSWGSTGTSGSWGGSTGSTGSWGSTGSTGSWGSTGSTGSWGSTGSTGSWGSTGGTGSWGSTGSKGSWGSTGSTGSWGGTTYSTYKAPKTTPTYTYSTYTAPKTTTPTYTYSTYTAPKTPVYTYSTYSAPTYKTSSNYTVPNYSYSTPSYSYSTPSYNYNYTYTSGGNNPVQHQPVCQIYANPSSVAYNGSTTVTWNSNYATSASLSGVGSVATNGSYTFNNLTSGRTFVLTVSGNGGSNTCSTVVYVQPQTQTPSCTLTANPTSVTSGGNTTLTWSSTNATSASLTDVGSVALNGSYTFNGLTTTKTYILTVSGNGGTNTCSTVVNVQPQTQTPFCTITANPSSVQSGGSSTVSWTSTNATSASLSEVGSVALNGSYTFSGLTTTKTYILTVSGQGGTNTCTTSVGVYDQPQQAPYCTLTIVPSVVYQNNYNNGYNYNNGSAVISWTASNATSAYIDTIGSVNAYSGSQTIYPGTSRSYTMHVYGANGQSNTCVGYVTVQNTQTNNLSCTISATPAAIANGNSSTLTWTSTNAVSASLSDGIGSVLTNGSLQVTPEASRYYVLTVRDANGNTQTCATNLSVNGTYVSLTQIPYTGFDFGMIGNTIYWALLAGGVASAAYFMTMYRGGVINYALALAGVRSNRKNYIVASEGDEDEAVEEPAVSVDEDEEETSVSSGDAMTLEMVNGMPRLSINRAAKGVEGLPGQQ